MEGRPQEEDDLVGRAKRGDTRAYEEIVERYQRIAFRVAYVFAGSAADAEEAAQDAFVKAHRALHRFRSGEPLRPWLLRIVANEARNRRRSTGRRLALAARAASAAEGSSGDAAPSPEAVLVASERRTELIAAVNALRQEDREVIACRFFLDLSEEDTASALGLPKGTVKSRLSRALGRLRQELGGSADD